MESPPFCNRLWGGRGFVSRIVCVWLAMTPAGSWRAFMFSTSSTDQRKDKWLFKPKISSTTPSTHALIHCFTGRETLQAGRTVRPGMCKDRNRICCSAFVLKGSLLSGHKMGKLPYDVLHKHHGWWGTGNPLWIICALRQSFFTFPSFCLAQCLTQITAPLCVGGVWLSKVLP